MQTLAAVFEGQPFEHAMTQLPVPTPQGEEVLVRVLGATICGSDQHTYEGRRQVATPTILGHEIVGEIVAFGETSDRKDLAGEPLAIGDRVTWAIVANCGACFFCDHQLPQKCEHAIKYGHEALRPDYQLSGGFAGHCLLAPGTAIVPLPQDLPLEVACPANCATATTAAAIEAAGELAGQTVAILGAGLIGLTAAAMAARLGAAQVLVVDPDPHRLRLAPQFGATHNLKPEQLSETTASLTRHGLDVVIEASGANAAFTAAFPLLRIGGTAVLVGSVTPAPEVPLGLQRIVRRNLRIVGVHNYAPPQLRTAVDFLATAHTEHPFASLVSAWFPLTALADAFTAARDRRHVRVGIRSDTP